jgi:drug/metabolite transporter (DMT)-like permease
MPQQSYTYGAIGLMILSMSLIVGGDAAAKLLSGADFSPYFVAWTRFALAAVILVPFSGIRRAELALLFDKRVLLRGLLIALAICSILTALKTEPLANAFGGFFIGPVVSYFLSALALKETITWQRTALLALSFVGVLLVVKPGFGMTSGMGFAVLAGCLHGSFLVVTRSLAQQYRAKFLLASQLLIGTVVLSPFSLVETPDMNMGIMGLIIISALGSAFGNLLLLVVNQKTPASVVAPLVYSQLLSAMVIGYLVFADWPDGLSFFGLAIIMISGVWSFWLAIRQTAH